MATEMSTYTTILGFIASVIDGVVLAFLTYWILSIAISYAEWRGASDKVVAVLRDAALVITFVTFVLVSVSFYPTLKEFIAVNHF